MAYEVRNGKACFYLTLRDGGRFKRQYFGAGPAGAIAAQQVAERKARREQQRQQTRQRIATLQASVQCVVAVEQQLDRYLFATLVAGGFHKHKRSKWRRRREHASKRNGRRGHRPQ